MSTGRVMTVRGPVPAPDLGITLMHEHVFIDLSFLWDAPASDWQKPFVDAEITLANRGLLQVDPYVSRRNLLLDEFDVAVEELAPFRQLGGSSVVDLTTTGIRPQPAKLREVSERTGLHVIAGCGYYTQRSHASEVATLSESGSATSTSSPTLPITARSSSVALTWSTTRSGQSRTSTATVPPNRAIASASTV